MVNIAALTSANAARWAAMQLDPNRIHEFDAVARRLCDPEAKAMYVAIEAATRVWWPAIAVTHEREAGQLWDRHLGQGDRLDRPTVNEPANRGPFFGTDAFYRGALDALIDCPPYASKWTDWTPGGTLTLLERYNGTGYATKGKPSPYVWSGTNQNQCGKYIRDKVYDPNVWDEQDGCAPLLKRMMLLDSSIKFASTPGVIIPPKPALVTPPAPPTHILVPDFVRTFKNWI